MQNVKLLTRKEYSPDFILYFCKKRLPMLFEELKQRRTIRKYTGEVIERAYRDGMSGLNHR